MDYSEIFIFCNNKQKKFIRRIFQYILSAILHLAILRTFSKIANLLVRDNIFPHNERRHLNQPPIGYRVPINPF